MNRKDMMRQLIQNEIDWLVGDPTFENVNSVVEFFTNGGFDKLSDNEIKARYERLTSCVDGQ